MYVCNFHCGNSLILGLTCYFSAYLCLKFSCDSEMLTVRGGSAGVEQQLPVINLSARTARNLPQRARLPPRLQPRTRQHRATSRRTQRNLMMESTLRRRWACLPMFTQSQVPNTALTLATPVQMKSKRFSFVADACILILF